LFLFIPKWQNYKIYKFQDKFINNIKIENRMNPIQDLGKQERIAFPENKTDIPLESHIEREDKKEEILISAINSSAPVLLQNIEIVIF